MSIVPGATPQQAIARYISENPQQFMSGANKLARDVRATYNWFRGRSAGAKRKSNGNKRDRQSKRSRGSGHATKASTGGRVHTRTFNKKKGNKSKMTFDKWYNNYKKEHKRNHSTMKILNSSRITCNVNQVTYTNYSILNQSHWETITANILQEIGQDNAGATRVETLNLQSVTGSEIKLDSAFIRVKMRNNGLKPVRVRVYWYSVKQSTGDTPVSLMTPGLSDVGASTSTSTLYYPTENKLISQFYKLEDTSKFELKCGDSVESYFSRKNLNYEPDYDDTASAREYMKGKTFICLIRIQGVVCHDQSSPTNVGFADAELDTILEGVYKTSYEGSGSLTRYDEALGITPGSITTPVVGCHDVEQL